MQHDSPPLTKDFLKVAEFAEALGVPVARVQAWIREGQLPAVRLGRLILIPKDALQRMLDRQEGRHGR